MSTCHYCASTDKETRPYGPNGASVCFHCAMATPERKTQTDAAFLAQLNAGNFLLIGEETGPRPLARKPS